jgi:hypothetical protein
MQSIATFLIFAAVASAALRARQTLGNIGGPLVIDYVISICRPLHPNGTADLNAPCNQADLIAQQCIYGAPALAEITAVATAQSGNYPIGGDDPETPTFSNATQRDCVCGSRWFQAQVACGDCQTAHGEFGDTNTSNAVLVSYESSFSASYCASTNMPSLGFVDVLIAKATGELASATTTVTQTSLYTDPVGNNTALSLYYTPSVTGSAAYIVPQGTETPSNNSITSSSGTSSGSSGGASASPPIVATSAGGSTEAFTGTTSGSATGSAAAASSSTAGNSVARFEAAGYVGAIILGLAVVL